MKKLLIGLMAVLLITAAALPTWAAVYKADPVHSSILFRIKHISGIVVGHFMKYQGQLDWDSKTGQLKDVKFTIETGSINTFIKQRDDHLKSADFFEAAKYPSITFASQSTKRNPKDPQEIWLGGVLTLKGVSKDVVFKMRYLGEHPNPMDKTQTVAGFSGGLTINRLDYKVGSGKFYTMGMVGKDVEIEINFETIRTK